MGRQFLICDWPRPQAIISDRDPAKFISRYWQGLWKATNTRLFMSKAYHPQTDGLSERKNQTVELALRHGYHIAEHPDDQWIDILPALQWNLNKPWEYRLSDSREYQPLRVFVRFPDLRSR